MHREVAAPQSACRFGLRQVKCPAVLDRRRHFPEGINLHRSQRCYSHTHLANRVPGRPYCSPNQGTTSR